LYGKEEFDNIRTTRRDEGYVGRGNAIEIVEAVVISDAIVAATSAAVRGSNGTAALRLSTYKNKKRRIRRPMVYTEKGGNIKKRIERYLGSAEESTETSNYCPPAQPTSSLECHRSRVQTDLISIGFRARTGGSFVVVLPPAPGADRAHVRHPWINKNIVEYMSVILYIILNINIDCLYINRRWKFNGRQTKSNTYQVYGLAQLYAASDPRPFPKIIKYDKKSGKGVY